MRTHRLERFGDRVDWLWQNLEPTLKYAEWIDEPPGKPLPATRKKATGRNRVPMMSRTDLWHALAWIFNLADPKIESWDQYCVPSSKRPVPGELILGLERLFPELAPGDLAVGSYEAFEALMLQTTESRARWLEAEEVFRTSRPKLEIAGKAYHAEADDFPADFPLIGCEGWLLDEPQAMSETDALPLWKNMPALETPRLEGLNCGWVDLKARLAHRNHKPQDRESYRVLAVRREGERLELELAPASYFQYVNGLEARGAELADNLANGRTAYDPRRWPLRGAPRDIRDLWSRNAVAGISCLTILKNYYIPGYSDGDRRKRDVFLLHQRTDRVLEAQNTFHVLPAGTHQPVSGFGDAAERNPWNTAVREFCEELFNMEAAIAAIPAGHDIRSLPEVDHLIEGFFGRSKGPPAAEIYLLGVGLDPVTCKPEILAVIVADWEMALKRKQVVARLTQHYEGKFRQVPLSPENLLEWVTPPGGDMLPAGAACLLRTHALYDRIMARFDARQ